MPCGLFSEDITHGSIVGNPPVDRFGRTGFVEPHPLPDFCFACSAPYYTAFRLGYNRGKNGDGGDGGDGCFYGGGSNEYEERWLYKTLLVLITLSDDLVARENAGVVYS